MSEEAVQEQPAEPQVTPEVAQARDALATYERTHGDAEFADEFQGRAFESVEDVYQAYGSREGAVEKTNDPPQEGDGDDLILGKFKSQADLEAAYKALESKLGQPKEDPKDSKGTPEDGEGSPLEIPGDPEGNLLTELNEHYAEHGSLTDDHYDKLAKAGFTKGEVDQFIQLAQAGAQATAQAAQAAEVELKNSVGGAEKYESMINWAKGNLSDSEIDAYNKAVSSDPGVAKLAIEGLKARWQSQVGTGSTKGMVSGANTSSQSGARGYESEAEIAQAINDPRFNTSPSYRREVEARMAKTNL